MANTILMLTGIFLLPLIGAVVPNPNYRKDVSGLFLNSLDDLQRGLHDPALENKPFEKLRALVTKVLDLTESALISRWEAGDRGAPTIIELHNVRVYRSVLPQIFGPLEHLVFDQNDATLAQKFLNSPAFTDVILQNLKPALRIASSGDRDKILQQIQILSGVSSGSSYSDPSRSRQLPFTNFRIPKI